MSNQSPPRAPTRCAITVRSADAGVGLMLVVLTAAGSWDSAMHHRGAAVLRECLAARPAGFIIDLTALHDPDAQSLPMWAGARHIGANIHPLVPVALCVDPLGALAYPLQRATTRHVLPVYATVVQAHIAINNQIPENPLRATTAGLRTQISARIPLTPPGSPASDIQTPP